MPPEQFTGNPYFLFLGLYTTYIGYEVGILVAAIRGAPSGGTWHIISCFSHFDMSQPKARSTSASATPRCPRFWSSVMGSPAWLGF